MKQKQKGMELRTEKWRGGHEDMILKDKGLVRNLKAQKYEVPSKGMENSKHQRRFARHKGAKL